MQHGDSPASTWPVSDYSTLQLAKVTSRLSPCWALQRTLKAGGGPVLSSVSPSSDHTHVSEAPSFTRSTLSLGWSEAFQNSVGSRPWRGPCRTRSPPGTVVPAAGEFLQGSGMWPPGGPPCRRVLAGPAHMNALPSSSPLPQLCIKAGSALILSLTHF